MPIKTTSLFIRASYILMVLLAAEGFLGINWGRLATKRMIPSMVVDILLQNNITEVKLYSASDNVLQAFPGSSINLAITMPNEATIFTYSLYYADKWLEKNVARFMKWNVTYRYIFVGTEPLSPKFFNQTYKDFAMALDYIQQGLDKRKLTKTKATTSHYPDILTYPITKPSEAEFRPEIRDVLYASCKTLKRSNAPFGLDIFPHLHVQEHFGNDTEFGFFKNNSTSKFTDGEFTYNNVVEVIYDSVAIALEKLGFPEIPILISAIGWPTDGSKDTNLINAERFHQGLAEFVKSQKGTPRRPGNIDVYIHNLVDENVVKVKAGPFMRHWGIYKFDGLPKFSLDFQGHGRRVFPVSAVGITHRPNRWCVLNVAKIDSNQIPFETLDRYYNNACNVSDCTAMSPGGSCSALTFPQNYSYAFNTEYQANTQNSCDYGGYGMIVSENPSMPNCTFPVEIIAAENIKSYGQYSLSEGFILAPGALMLMAVITAQLWMRPE